MDEERIVLKNGSVMPGEEVMLRGLYELVTGEFQSSVAINVFGRELSQQSRAFTYFIDHLYSTFCYLLLDNLEWFYDEGLLEESRQAVRRKLIELGYSFEVREKQTIGLFIDCNCLKTCRPGGGPITGGHDGLRYDTLVQQTFYNGWKSSHGLKHQTLDMAHGITCNLFGPLSLRHNDLHLLGQSNLIYKLEALYYNSPQKVTIFGDSAYPTSDYLRYYFPSEIATRHQKENNKVLKSVRETIEHNYALTRNLYKYLSRLDKLKILNNKTILKVYTVCTFLRNCHVMMYGCETSNFFNVIMDSNFLYEKYTRLNANGLQMQDISVLKNLENLSFSRSHLERACVRHTPVDDESIGRLYLPTNKISCSGIKLGLAQSKIPGAGLGVFLLADYSEGTRLCKYGGKMITEEELNQPGYNTTYVWSDKNNIVNLALRGLTPLILDANPDLDTLSWGGMINDGITIPANVTLIRFRIRFH